ncbi:MAG: 4Fe-4S dicluster domain-containing protein [Endomicrobiales bacterium]|nr:4Fe-4S dicluster domain-containing protein [Endomicrobiales bacterium]
MKKIRDLSKLTRAQFLLSLFASILSLTGFRRRRRGQNSMPEAKRPVIRPPGALPENEFVQRCIRCGNCMKVCITNVLQPTLLESGWQGVWTPYLSNKIAYCEYKCTLCGQVCPTGAIKKLREEEKTKTKIGTAHVHKRRCLVWEYGTECLVCEEHCPVSKKAIKTEKITLANGKTILAPVVDKDLCIGCGICENKCPASPLKAIEVVPQ